MNEDFLAAELGTVTSLVPRDQLDGRHTTPVDWWRLQWKLTPDLAGQMEPNLVSDVQILYPALDVELKPVFSLALMICFLYFNKSENTDKRVKKLHF